MIIISSGLIIKYTQLQQKIDYTLDWLYEQFFCQYDSSPWFKYKIVMSYLRNDYSLSYSSSGPADSGEHQIEYLKLKLIEMHSKLMKELQYSRGLEESIKEWELRYESTMSENQSLVKKMNSISSKAEKDRANYDKARQLELNLVDSEKKNDLLRIDLESMRSKVVELISAKQAAEQGQRASQLNYSKANDKLIQALRQVKSIELETNAFKDQLERYKGKYQKQASLNRQIQYEISELKREKQSLIRNIEQLESVLRGQRQKQSKNMNQLLLMQKQVKQWKIKAQNISEQHSRSKEEAYNLRLQIKSEKSLLSDLERLTSQYNNLQSLYRQKQTELQLTLRKNQEQNDRKRTKLSQTKEMVGKLEKEQQLKLAGRSSPSPRTKSAYSPKGRSYKEEKEEYLSIIQSVGTMENEMLACNMQRKRIVSEIDKIDQTRVKTKEMISKRRRLEVQLQNQEKKLEHIRNELKKMKVM